MKIIKFKEGEIFDIELAESLLEKNRRLALENKALLDSFGIKAVDVMGSIGSGKTTLLSKIIRELKRRYKIAAIAGDLTTTLDAQMLAKAGALVVQVNTGKECHLDANLIKRALNELPLKKINLIFIENVGNLICPAEFPLGTHKRIVVVSFTEGPFMIVKHPYIFLEADVVVCNKADMARKMKVKFAHLQRQLLKIKPGIKVISTSARQGKGIKEVISALEL